MHPSTLPAHRLHAQRLLKNPLTTPLDVVRWLGAVQAQDYHQALWALGSRLPEDKTRADVEAAIEAGTILRTWPMRGTIHFVPAEDARWMVELSREKMLAKTVLRKRQLEISEEDLRKTEKILIATLSGGKRVARPDIIQALEDGGLSTPDQRGYHLLWHFAQCGLICIGPNIDKQQSYVLLEEWVPNSRQLSREEALETLAERYFTGHGPATVHDFANWASLTMADARSGLASIRGKLAHATIEQQEFWWHEEHASPDPERSSLHLLAGFDEYLLGYKQREQIIEKEHLALVVPGANGIFKPMLVRDGKIMGIWKRTEKKRLRVEITPFLPFEDAERARLLAGRYARFAGYSGDQLELTVGSITRA